MALLASRAGASPPRGARVHILALVLLSLFGVSAAAQASVPSREYQVKAAFLFNFAQFVDWPPAAFAEESAPLAICVLGDDPFGSYLDELVRGEQVNGRHLSIQRFRAPDEVRGCQVLFVSRSQMKNLAKTLASAKAMDALTVSDVDDFAERGGMIQLKTESGKIRIKININAAKASNLVISSKLLRSAEIVAGRSD